MHPPELECFALCALKRGMPFTGCLVQSCYTTKKDMTQGHTRATIFPTPSYAMLDGGVVSEGAPVPTAGAGVQTRSSVTKHESAFNEETQSVTVGHFLAQGGGPVSSSRSHRNSDPTCAGPEWSRIVSTTLGTMDFGGSFFCWSMKINFFQ